jgi:hypothetical protein
MCAGAAWCNPRWHRDADDTGADSVARFIPFAGKISDLDSNLRFGFECAMEYANVRSSHYIFYI